MCDCEFPAAYSTNWRLARKDHECCECHEVIRAGTRYKYFSGVWENTGLSFKTCETCEYAREDYYQLLPAYYCRPCFGALWDEVRDTDGMSREEWLYGMAVA